MRRTSRALLAATVCVALSIWLGGCTTSTKVPEPVLQEQNENMIFEITVIPNQDPFHYPCPYRSMQADGTVVSRFVSPMESRKHWAGPLAPEQQEEIRQILKTMIAVSSHNPFDGKEVITLSFLWHSQPYTRSFSMGNCPDDLMRLFDITNSVWSDEFFHWEPCRRVEFVESIPLDDSRRLLTSLPDEIIGLHAHRLFQVHWFEQPFSGSYKQLYFVIDEHEFDFLGPFDGYGVYQNEPGGRGFTFAATDTAIQEIQEILARLVDIDETERPKGDTLIVLGFSWEADYHLLVFGDENCPDSLRRLFEIADISSKRNDPERNLIWIPCQGK